MNFHIFRITQPETDEIIISPARPARSEFEFQAIASFATQELRDLMMFAIEREIKSNPKFYPNHKVRRQK